MASVRGQSFPLLFASDVRKLERRSRTLLLVFVCGIVAVMGATILLTGVAGVLGTLAMLAAAGSVGFVIWLWHDPIRGLFILFIAAVGFDVNYTETTDGGYFIAHYVPFWQDFTAWTRIHVVVSVAELLMAVLLAVWLLKVLAAPHVRFEWGTMGIPIGLYAGMLLIAEFHGVSTGGNVTKSMWELRGQIYMIFAYVLACNLIRSRRHITTLLWLLLLMAGLRGAEGLVRYFVYFRGHISGNNVDVFPHEQAFFLNGFVILTLILLIYDGPPRMKRFALYLTPVVFAIDLATQRRAAVLAMAVSLLLLMVATLITHPRRRKPIGLALVGLAICLPPYYIVFQNSYSTIAEPARAIGSIFHPSNRDAGSNQYRIDEDFDIMATMRTSPIIGYGFGKPMLTPHPLADISKIYIWWNYMPHNSILWIWMRMGTLGYIIFWGMIGSAVIQSLRLLRRLKSPFLQGMALFVALMVVQEIVFGYLDLQWTNYRNLFAVGILFALISRLEFIARQDGALASEAKELPRVQQSSTVPVPVGRRLAVIDGRLKGT